MGSRNACISLAADKSMSDAEAKPIRIHCLSPSVSGMTNIYVIFLLVMMPFYAPSHRRFSDSGNFNFQGRLPFFLVLLSSLPHVVL